MAVLAKVGTLHEHLPSVLVDPCLYYCCTTHQALVALRSLCTEGCARTVRSTCVGVRNVIREFIWTAATLLCAQIRTGFFDVYCTYIRKFSFSYDLLDTKYMKIFIKENQNIEIHVHIYGRKILTAVYRSWIMDYLNDPVTTQSIMYVLPFCKKSEHSP